MSENVTQEIMTTAFGEVATAQNVPITQITAQYSLLEGTLTVLDNNSSGSAFAQDSLFQAESGTDPAGLAAILTSKQLAYRAGQGALARISAIFDIPADNYQQGAGLINSEDVFAFGSVNSEFGVIHSFNGVVEAQELTITVPAAGAENATITLDGTPYSVPLTASTVEVNAWEIAESLTAQDSVHRCTSNGNTVYVLNIVSKATTTYSFTSGTAVAAFVQKAVGAAPTTVLIPQSDWNIDTMNTLNIDKLNDYQVQYNGVIEFSIQDSTTGMMNLVHRIEHTNNNILPSASNPIFRVGWLIQNKGNIINKSIKGSFASSFIEGVPVADAPPRALTASAVGIATSATNLIAFRNRTHFGDKVNRIAVLLKFLSFATQANKPVFFELIIDPVFSSPVDFEYQNKEGSTIEFTKDNVLVTGGQIVGATTVVSGPSQIIDASKNILASIGPSTVFCISARVSSGAAGDMQASVTFQEDF